MIFFLAQALLNCDSDGVLRPQTIAETETSVVVDNTCTKLIRGSINYSWVTSVTLPDTITTFEDDCFVCPITTLIIPKSVIKIHLSNPFTFLKNSTEIKVDTDNSQFASVDGILYSKNITELIYCPASNGLTTFRVPAGVVKIWNQAFNYHKTIETLILATCPEYIGSLVFYKVFTLKTFLIPYGCEMKTLPDTFKFSSFDKQNSPFIYYLESPNEISGCEYQVGTTHAIFAPFFAFFY